MLPYLPYALFANVFVWFVNSGRWRKGIISLGCLALIYAVIKCAVIAPISCLYQVMVRESAKPELGTTTSPEYFGRYIADYVGNYTFNLRNRRFPYYVNLSLPDFGNFGYSWGCLISMFLVSLSVFLVWCKIKPWCRRKCREAVLTLLRCASARCADATSSSTTATAASTTSAAAIAAPATTPAAPPLRRQMLHLPQPR